MLFFVFQESVNQWVLPNVKAKMQRGFAPRALSMNVTSMYLEWIVVCIVRFSFLLTQIIRSGANSVFADR